MSAVEPEAVPLDLRLLPAALGAWAAGLLSTSVSAAWGTRIGVLGLIAGAGLAAAVIPPTRRSGWRLVALAAVLCATGVQLGGAWRVHTLTSGPVQQLAADHAMGTAELVVSADPVARKPAINGNTRAPDGLVLRARLETLLARGQQWQLRVPVLLITPARGWADLLPGQRFRCMIRLIPASAGDDVAALATVSGPLERLGEPPVTQRIAGRLRADLRESVAGLAPDERGLVPGLVVGDVSAEPADLTDAFRAAGMSHLTAVSGSNVAFVLAAVLFLARWLGLRGRILPWCAALGLAGFVVLARPQPSVLRAAVMGLVALVALVRVGRPIVGLDENEEQPRGRGLPALLGGVVLLLFIDPFLSRAAGFALSVLAAGGLIVLAPAWRVRLTRRMPAILADALVVPAAAQLAVAPVLVLLNPAISLVAIPANLLAAPAVAPATLLGVASSVVGPVAPPVAVFLAHLAAIPATWIVWVARIFSDLPGGSLGWPSGVPGALLLAAVLLAVKRASGFVRLHPRPFFAMAAVGLLLMWLPLPGRSSWPPAGWLLVACSVGQGDGLVLNAGDGTALVVDTGPDPRAIDRCLRDLGVRRVPLVVLTHFHADHVEGLPGVLRGREVGEVEVSPLAEPADEVSRVTAWTSQAGVPMTVAGVGEQRELGQLQWTVLWPQRLIRSGGSPPNNASVVLRLTVQGVVILLTGDIEPAAQHALLSDPANLEADVFKVPHHGSRNQDPALVREVRPRLALVSVGLGNTYGHPAESTLALVRSAGAAVGRTDTDGDLAIVGPKADLRLVARGLP